MLLIPEQLDRKTECSHETNRCIQNLYSNLRNDWKVRETFTINESLASLLRLTLRLPC